MGDCVLDSFSPQSVLITGANRGLGLEFVKQFLQLNNPPKHVFATCRNPANAETLQKLAADNLTVHIIKLDITDYASFPLVVQTIQDFLKDSGLNLLINNAGMRIATGFEDVTAEEMRINYESNVIAPLMWTKAVLPLLERSAGQSVQSMSCTQSAVINISSRGGCIAQIAAFGGSYIGRSTRTYPYWTSKAALNMVSTLMSKDLQEKNILLIILDPGWVQTDMGGPKGPITPEVSIHGMLNAMAHVTYEQRGCFINYRGEIVPW